MKANASGECFLSSCTGTDSNLLPLQISGCQWRCSTCNKVAEFGSAGKCILKKNETTPENELINFLSVLRKKNNNLAHKWLQNTPLVLTNGTNCPHVTYLWFLSDLFTIAHCRSMLQRHRATMSAE